MTPGGRRAAAAAARQASAERRGLHGRVVDHIGLMIVSGELGEDAALVPEELGARFGVSRTVVRETFRVLESKGLVKARQRVGTRVRPEAEWDFLDPDVIAWRQQSRHRREQMRELFELRITIEPAAARLAALRARRGAIRDMANAYNGMQDALADGDMATFRACDMAFHHALLAACGNQLFAQLNGTVGAALRTREELITSPDQIDPEAMRLHGAVLDAISAGNGERAYDAMLRLVEQTAPGQTSSPA